MRMSKVIACLDAASSMVANEDEKYELKTLATNLRVTMRHWKKAIRSQEQASQYGEDRRRARARAKYQAYSLMLRLLEAEG